MKNVGFADVSVIVPCYQCVDTIERAVVSVARQTLLPLEIVLVDDCSVDNTLEELYRLQGNYQKGWVSVLALENNVGSGEARNLGWQKAEGKYIAFLDADDAWYPQKIEIQYTWMEAHPKVVVTGHCCGRWPQDDKHSYLDSQVKDGVARKITKKRMLLSNQFSTPTVMLKRYINIRFENRQRYSEDYHLWLRIICSGHCVYIIDLPLASLFKAPYGEKGLSSQLLDMQKGEFYTYRSLYLSGKIPFMYSVFYISISLAKFLKRLFFVKLFH